MTYQRPCQARVPQNCPYHGANGLQHSVALREQLNEKYNLYVSSQQHPKPGMDSAFDAWEDYRKAEKAYYSTDEGLNHLEIQLALGSVSQENYERVKRDALDYRFTKEMEAPARSSWAEKQLASVKPFPVKLYSTKPVDGVHFISEVKDATGEYTNKFLWDEKSQWVYIEVQDSHGQDDLEAMTMIGKADNQDQALYKAFEWYRKRGGQA